MPMPYWHSPEYFSSILYGQSENRLFIIQIISLELGRLQIATLCIACVHFPVNTTQAAETQLAY